MKNPVFWRSLFVVGIAIIIVGVFLLTRQKSSSRAPIDQQAQTTVEEKVPSQTTKTYTDEAGFSFDYPDDVTVSKKESTSSAVYSSLEITSEGVPGSMAFLIEDTKVKFVNELLQNNITTKETTLGNLKATETEDAVKTVLLAIDQGILFKLEINPDKNKSYWDSVYKIVLSSFSFVAPKSATSDSLESGEEIILEEDVIE